MTTRPHDMTDVMLAPVALRIDQRIESLGEMDAHALATEVAVETNRATGTEELRRAALLEAIAHLSALHGWQLRWAPRGVRLVNGANTFVLGTPPVFAGSLAGEG